MLCMSIQNEERDSGLNVTYLHNTEHVSSRKSARYNERGIP
jgi:hypothetical protein